MRPAARMGRAALSCLAALALAAAAPCLEPAPAHALEAPASVAVELSDSGPVVTWSPVAGASRYDVYRKLSGGKWKKLKTIVAIGTFQGVCTFVDPDELYAGRTYAYRVRVHAPSSDAAGVEQSTYSASAKFKAPALKETAPRVSRSGKAKSMKVCWTRSRYAGGYTLQYATTKSFSDLKSIAVKGKTVRRKTVKGLSASKTYYVRVRAYQKQGDETARSAWGYSANARAKSTVGVTRLKAKKTLSKERYQKARAKAKASLKAARKRYKAATSKKVRAKRLKACAEAKSALHALGAYRYDEKSGKYVKSTPFEIAEAAGQRLGAYDTVQGSCSDGTYAYFVLNNRLRDDCRIAKVRLHDRKLMKVSGTLAIGHGNDVTYDPTRKWLVVAQASGHGLVLPVVDAQTLQLEKKIELELPADLEGATKAQIARAKKGVSSIARDSKTGKTIAVLTGSRNLLVLSSSYKPLRYVKVDGSGEGVRQGAELVGRMLYVAESPGSGLAANSLHVYDLDGNTVRTVRLGVGSELESVFAAGSRLYASVYASTPLRNNHLYRVDAALSEL